MTRLSRWMLCLLIVAAAALAGVFAPRGSTAATAAGTAAGAGRSLLENRPEWTTSRVQGAPEPPSMLATVPYHAGVKFDRPVHLAVAPGVDRWFVAQEMAQVVSVPFAEGAATKPEPFADLRIKDAKDPKAGDRRRLWSIVFHPRFQENGYVYACYIEYGKPANVNRIVRLTVPADGRKPGAVPRVDPATELPIIEWVAGIDHFGGCLAFGPTDGMLYFSAGDGHGYADGNQTGQDISDLNASLLRIDVDHPAAGKNYAIPADNPFVNTPGARGEVWAYGLRNVWKFSIAADGTIWACDVGQDLWEPVVRVEKGGNYGWSVVEGTHDFRPERKRGPTPILKPVYEHEHSEARSITGGYVYRGSQFPELKGLLVYGDYDTGKVWSLDASSPGHPKVVELVDTPLKLVAFGQAHDGELVLLDYQGTMHRPVRNPDAAPNAPVKPAFPRKLSETGLFASTREHKMAPGVVPYDVTAALWSDGAYKHRYIALPPGGKIKYSADNAWGFPEGSVIVKTFELEMTKGDPASRRRLETRLLHIEQDHWRGYTYVWNDAQTDADLLDAGGKTQTFTVADPAAPGGKRDQSWRFPSRAECTLCHTMPAGFVLGPNTLQMNRAVDYGVGPENQIAALEKAGLFDKPVLAQHKADGKPAASYDALPKMPGYADANVPVADRARAYLAANCSHCHRQWGGGNALFELQYTLPLEKTKTVDVGVQHGTHDLVDPRLIVPGHPDRSMIVHRMKDLGPARMPRVGSSVIDPVGVSLVEQWVREMKPSP
ncbi:MAG TPA: PQQ-dependent sugar dehydrogenase [Humisphaera sp.]